MSFLHSPRTALIIGVLLISVLVAVGARINGPPMAARLSEKAAEAIAGVDSSDGVTASFISPTGQPSRHPLLSGAEQLSEATRDRIAKAVAAVPGVGGIRWADGDARADAAPAPVHPRHCQDDVQALLRARTIRFEESSARIDRASLSLIDEVAQALRPCLGSIIAITGHTDSSGPEPGNLALSEERAEAVQLALIERDIPADGLRVRGMGSSSPVEGLDPTDPANRRIEFSVIATEPIVPTPVDTPGPN